MPRTPHPTMAIELIVIVDPRTLEEEDNAKEDVTGHEVSKEKNIKDTMACSIILCLFVSIYF